MTVGVPPTTGDLGSEADTLTPTTGPVPDENAGQIRLSDTWSFVLKGYLRAPMRISYGPRDDGAPGNELHSPPRMVGGSSSNWSYINIAPNPTGSLRASISNERVTGTLIISTNTFTDVGYQDIDSQGGVAQGYVTLKFPDAFGMRGGLAWTLGAFSNRYGYAGHRQVNSGYYGVYLFGRTRTVGEALTANIDLTDHVELLIEHGVGAELDALPQLSGNLQKQMFIPGDPARKLGSDFVMHGHVSLWIDEWLKIGTHYLTSYSPVDVADSYTASGAVTSAQLSVVGAEVHLDHPRWGNGFIGFSHIWGHDLMFLNDALTVVHGSRGYDFKLQYFGNKLRHLQSSSYWPNDSGHVETILFQHKFYSNGLLNRPIKSQGAMLALFGMYSHAYSPPKMGFVDPVSLQPTTTEVSDNKLKFGAEFQYQFLKNIAAGLRFDRVQPTQLVPDSSYSAVTLTTTILSDWNSSRRIITSYTRYFLGANCFPDSPYSSINRTTDPNLFLVSALMSL